VGNSAPRVNVCPICRARPADSREHVWPQWFLRRLDAHSAPTGAWTSNGEPITNRDRVQYAGRSQRERVILDICGACNNELDRRFEKPSQGLVEAAVLNRWVGPRSQSEWRQIGLWWVKLLLLLGLPSARYATNRINDKIVVRHDVPEALDLRWLTDGSAAPDELSLYAFHADMSVTKTVHTMPMPRYVTGQNGNRTHFHQLSQAMTGVCFTMVSHPGWPIDHPFVADGTAWELLHSPPPSGSDLSTMPSYGPKAIQWASFGAVLKPGHDLGSGLPPLRATVDALTPDPDVLTVLQEYFF
jgi:hypothetical protein